MSTCAHSWPHHKVTMKASFPVAIIETTCGLCGETAEWLSRDWVLTQKATWDEAEATLALIEMDASKEYVALMRRAAQDKLEREAVRR